MKKALICLLIVTILMCCVPNVVGATTDNYSTAAHSKDAVDVPAKPSPGIIMLFAPEWAKVNETFVIHGSFTNVSSDISGTRVYLLKLDENSSSTVCDAITDSNGTFDFYVTPHIPGEYDYQAVFYGDSHYAFSISVLPCTVHVLSPGALDTPILVSPVNNTVFYHYPRNTTLAWKPVQGADGYLVEIQYYSNGWHDWYSETVSSASYTFSFIGDQQGRWRVTALDSTGAWNDSTPSDWWTFNYET